MGLVLHFGVTRHEFSTTSVNNNVRATTFIGGWFMG